jgi:hypothetical protein
MPKSILSCKDVLSNPIIAVLDAQHNVNLHTLELINKYTDCDNYIKYNEYNIKNNEDSYNISIPELNLVHIPSLSIKQFNISLNLEDKSNFDSDSDSSSDSDSDSDSGSGSSSESESEKLQNKKKHKSKNKSKNKCRSKVKSKKDDLKVSIANKKSKNVYMVNMEVCETQPSNGLIKLNNILTDFVKIKKKDI